jgi:hypothetical protein
VHAATHLAVDETVRLDTRRSSRPCTSSTAQRKGTPCGQAPALHGDNPKEVAYYNDGKGHVHSGVFHYDDARGVMLASGSEAMHVRMLQPQMIAALGLPTPTDPDYLYR